MTSLGASLLSSSSEARLQTTVRGAAFGFFLAALLLSAGDESLGAVSGPGAFGAAAAAGGGAGAGGGRVATVRVVSGGAAASGAAFSDAAASAPPTRTQCSASWVVPRNASVDDTAPGGGYARGCPPEGQGLCGLMDVFDEVVVLTLPRRERQLRRLRSQLAALGAPHTEVLGFDKLTAVARAAWAMYVRDRVVVDLGYDSLGELCVGFGWLAILEHIVNSGRARTLVLEDDAVFHREFPAEFDRRARVVPEDWLLFYLGATQTLWGQDGAIWPENEVPDYYKLVNAWGAFAVGVSREAAIEMLAQHRKFDCRIDIASMRLRLRALLSVSHFLTLSILSISYSARFPL